MAWDRRTKKKSYCAYCGKEIKWVRQRGASKSTPVDPRCIYFLPDPNGQPLISSDGSERIGRIVNDGLLGYHRHDCPMLPRKSQLSEKERLARQWA